MLSDKENGFKITRPSHPMHYDRTMEFTKDRSFWLMLILGMCGGMYAKNKYICEKERMNRWVRMQDLENLPAHHFNNRGGVLVRKQFAGFEKYHKNLDEMMDWYKKAYPDLMKEWLSLLLLFAKKSDALKIKMLPLFNTRIQ